MPKAFISEDDIEQSILDKLEEEHLEYDILRLDPSPEKMDVLPDGTGRSDKKECVLPEIIWNSLKKLNPNVKEDLLKEVFNSLKADYTETDINQTNYDLYKTLYKIQKCDGLAHHPEKLEKRKKYLFEIEEILKKRER